MKDQFDQLMARIAAADLAYHQQDAPLMDDAAYDALRREAAEILAQHPEYAATELSQVGAKPASGL